MLFNINLRLISLLAVLASTLLVSNKAKGQIPIATDWVYVIYGAAQMHCSIDPITDNVFVSVRDVAQLNNEYIWEFQSDGILLDQGNIPVDSYGTIDWVEDFEARDDSIYSACGHTSLGGWPTWAWIRTGIDHYQLQTLMQWSVPHDLFVADTMVYVAGSHGDTAFVLSVNMDATQAWYNPIPGVGSKGAITILNDTVYAFYQPYVYKFSPSSGQSYGSSFIGGTGQGRCVAYNNEIYWASSNGSALHYGKFDPQVGMSWSNILNMSGTFYSLDVEMDDLGRMWISGHDTDGGHVMIIDQNGISTDNIVGEYVGDLSIKNGKVAIAGCFIDCNPSINGATYIQVGTVIP